MNAVEFNGREDEPAERRIRKQGPPPCPRKGLILLTCGVHGNVIRFLAPITIQDEVFAEALDIIEASILEARG